MHHVNAEGNFGLLSRLSGYRIFRAAVATRKGRIRLDQRVIAPAAADVETSG
jgi:hypothetical protein